jgi:cellulose biosynthesis protein BcsQ
MRTLLVDLDPQCNATTGFGTAAVNLGPGVTMYPVINYANSPQTFTLWAINFRALGCLSLGGA